MEKKDELYHLDMPRFWRIIKRSWLVILAVTILCGALGVAYAWVKQPTLVDVLNKDGMAYLSEDMFFLQREGSREFKFASDGESFGGYDKTADISSGAALAQPAVEFLNSQATLESIVEKLDGAYTCKTLKERVRIFWDDKSGLIVVRAVDPDKESAQMITRAFVEFFPEQFAAAVHGVYVATVVDATEPVALSAAQVESRTAIHTGGCFIGWKTKAALGVALGFVAALGCAILYDMLTGRVLDVSHIKKRWDDPVLAVIPTVSNGENTEEAYQRFCVNLESTLDEGKTSHTIGVTSGVPGEEKTETCLGLAESLAKTGKKVLLVDADMREAALSELLGGKKIGLAEVLSGDCSAADAIVKSEKNDNLFVLPAGKVQGNSLELLGKDVFVRTLESLTKDYDEILLDLPPVNTVSDSLLVAKTLEGLCVVAKEKKTKLKDLGKALEDLTFVKGRVLGIVLTGSKSK